MNHCLLTVNKENCHTLRSFVGWICDTDDHAEHHLALIDRVERCLDKDRMDREEAQSLAEKLERWRYQRLHQRRNRSSSREEAFVDALSLAANRLSGRTKLPPRRTRHAIHDTSSESDAFREAAEVIDPKYPLAKLEDRARQLTVEHFCPPDSECSIDSPQRLMLLYAPLYVSSYCVNHCTYCGFRYPLDIERRHLSLREVDEQVAILRKRGFDHLLIVGGEFPRLTSLPFYCDIARTLVDRGIVPTVEIAPQSTRGYEALARAGVCGLTLYQETYEEPLYSEYHTRGPKANYFWRLESHDRAAEAGLRRLGLGILLGLAESHKDVLTMMRHGAYLLDRFPDCMLSFSLPRIHEAPSGFAIRYPISDEQLIRLYCVLRIAFPRAHLVLSTRESASLRNRLARICITQMSAGSSTTPGGYGANHSTGGQQFPTTDQRSPVEIADWLEHAGFRVSWSLEPI